MVTKSSAATPSLADLERSIIADLGLLLFYGAHVAPSRSRPQHSRKLVQFLRRAGRVHFDSSIVQIARVPRQPQPRRRPLRKIPESHALHPPANQPPPRLLRHLRTIPRLPKPRVSAPPRQVHRPVLPFTLCTVSLSSFPSPPSTPNSTIPPSGAISSTEI